MVVPVNSPVPLFPSSPRISFSASPDPKLQAAVSAAITQLVAARGGDIPFSLAIVDLERGTRSGSLKWGAHKPNEEHYTASEVKVCALYAAFALHDLLSRFIASMGLVRLIAAGVGATAPPLPLFAALRKFLDPAIDAAGSPLLAALPRISRLPRYETVFVARAAGSSLPPAFTGDFLTSLELMIIPSDNHAAGRCARGVGFAYLNAALADAGLFDPRTKTGAWLSGDYVATPHRVIDTTNDKEVGQASSALSMAKLMALIVNLAVLDEPACKAMSLLLAAAAQGKDQPWLTREPTDKSAGVAATLRIPREKVTHAKLGLGPLKTGGQVCSEVFRLEALLQDRSYAVAFQNLNLRTSSFDDVAFVVWKALEIYEA